MSNKILKVIFALGLLMLSQIAQADTLALTGDYGLVPQYGGSYVGPINATLDGNAIPGGIVCTDEASISYFGSSFGVNISTLKDLSGTRFQSAVKYEEAVWLIWQANANPTQVGPIQFAEWGLFNPGFADNLDAASRVWLTAAENMNPADYNFDSVRIYTPSAGFTSNQEFLSAGSSSVPIPSSALLLASGLVGLWYRRGR